MKLSTWIIKPENRSLYRPILQPGFETLMKNYPASDENLQFHDNIFYIIKLIQLSQLTKPMI